MEPVHSVDGSASGGDRHVLLMERDPSLRAMHRDALLETDVQKAGLDMAKLMEQYSVIMWPKLHPLFVSIVRQYEGQRPQSTFMHAPDALMLTINIRGPYVSSAGGT